VLKLEWGEQRRYIVNKIEFEVWQKGSCRNIRAIMNWICRELKVSFRYKYVEKPKVETLDFEFLKRFRSSTFDQWSARREHLDTSQSQRGYHINFLFLVSGKNKLKPIIIRQDGILIDALSKRDIRKTVKIIIVQCFYRWTYYPGQCPRERTHFVYCTTIYKAPGKGGLLQIIQAEKDRLDQEISETLEIA